MNKKIFILFLIIAAAAFFRFWQIQNIPPGLYPDEAMNGNNGLETIHNTNFFAGWKIFYPENSGREGLFINIQAISVYIFGNKPWALRLVSGIFGTLTVLGVYFLTKKLFSQEIIAFISSFFLAISFWHINFSRIGFRAIMAPFFLVWSLYFLLMSFRKMMFFEEENKSKNLEQKFTSKFKKLKHKIFNIEINKYQIKFGNFAGIAGIFYGLGFHSYIAYRATPVLIILIFAYFWFKQKENRRKILFNGFFFLFSFFIIISPLLFYFINNSHDFLGRTAQISVFSSENPLKQILINTAKTFGMFWYQGDFNWRHNLRGNPELSWPIGILFGLGIIISIWRILNSRFKMLTSKSNPNYILPEILLIVWLIVGLLPVVISNEGIPHALRAIIIIPAVMIISAKGLELIIKMFENLIKKWQEKYPERAAQIQRIKKELFILLIIFLISTMIYSFNLYFLRWAENPNVADAFSKKYVEIGNYLNSLPKDLEKYVVVNAEGTDVRGLKMPAQTTMFITKTFLPEWQKEKNIYYILPGKLNQISCENSCVIAALENDPLLRKQLKEQIKNLMPDSSPGFVVLKNFLK